MGDAPHPPHQDRRGSVSLGSVPPIARRIKVFVGEVSERFRRAEGPFTDAADAVDFFERKACLMVARAGGCGGMGTG